MNDVEEEERKILFVNTWKTRQEKCGTFDKNMLQTTKQEKYLKPN